MEYLHFIIFSIYTKKFVISDLIFFILRHEYCATSCKESFIETHTVDNIFSINFIVRYSIPLNTQKTPKLKTVANS